MGYDVSTSDAFSGLIELMNRGNAPTNGGTAAGISITKLRYGDLVLPVIKDLCAFDGPSFPVEDSLSKPALEN